MLLLGHTGITVTINKSIEKRLGFRWSYWQVILLSIFPDIMDKFVGRFLFSQYFANGRLFAHTIVFLVIVGFAALISWARCRRAEAFGIMIIFFFHQLMDKMWLYPETWVWPAYGWGFPHKATDWWGGIWQILISAPYVYWSEIIGACLLLYYAVCSHWRQDHGK